MVYILLNWIGNEYPENIAIVTDTYGNTMTWNTQAQAYIYGKKNCQSFKAVRI